MADRISELRLTAFKSFRDVVSPLAPLTVLIGRNGAGNTTHHLRHTYRVTTRHG